MKKTIALFLTLVLSLTLCSCSVRNAISETTEVSLKEHITSIDADYLAGTWKLVGLVIDGVTFSTNELILMGQPAEQYDYYFVLKDGGLGIDKYGDSFSWSVTDNTITIDNMECLYEDGIISLVGESSTLRMQKTSDNQDISEAISSAETQTIVTAETIPATPETTPTEDIIIAEDTASELIDGMRPEFKEAMDAYEAFYDEYVVFMEKYQKNPLDMTLLFKYTEMLTKLDQMNKSFEAWNEDDLNDTELKYYLDVNNRVMKKLVDVAS